MKTDWSNYTIAYDGINYSVNYRDNGDLVACEDYVPNSPTPQNPQPLISNLPAGTYKVQDWRGDWWEFTLDEDLAGIDSVRDSIEFDKYSPANGWERNNYGVKIFDGSTDEYWVLQSINGHGIANFKGSLTHGSTERFLATHFKRQTTNIADTTDEGYLLPPSLSSFYFRIKSETASTVEEFRTWLSNNPVTIVYQLATPTRTPLTFTLNNASTAPECPMEFLTDTPSLEYPAEVFDAQGSVKVRNADDSKNATAPVPVLRSVGEVADTYKPKTGVKTKNVSDWVTFDGKVTQALERLNGFKRLMVNEVFNAPFGANQNFRCYKYDSTPIAYGSPSTSKDLAQGSVSDAGLRISVSNDDSGWSDTYAPLNNECKAYFYGWQMCHADGRTPYYKSEIPYNPTTWAEWTNSGTTVSDNKMVFTADEMNYKYTLRTVALKNNTKYALIFNIPSNTTTTNAFKFDNNDWLNNKTNINGTGLKKVVFTTATITNNRVIFTLDRDSAGNTVEIEKVRIYELPIGSQIEADFETLTADQLNEKYPFDGLNVKHWKRLMGTESEIQASITPTLPTASYDGFTPYKMIYQLAEPIEEQYDPVTLPTYYPTTVITTTNDTPAELTTTATVKVEDEE